MPSRFQVVVRSCNAGSRGGGKYRRPAVIRVIDTHVADTDRGQVLRGTVREWRNVDSRYRGPRSEFGKAFAAAEALAAELNSNSQSAIAQ